MLVTNASVTLERAHTHTNKSGNIRLHFFFFLCDRDALSMHSAQLGGGSVAKALFLHSKIPICYYYRYSFAVPHFFGLV